MQDVGWHVFRTTADQPLEIVGTSSPAIREFRDSWMARDPFCRGWRGRPTDPVLPFSRLPEWRAMSRHPVYADFAPSWGFKHFACVRLTPAPFLAPGSTQLMLIRGPRRPDFDGDDVLDLAQLHPRLRAAVVRGERAARARAVVAALEAVVAQAAPGVHVVLDGRGAPLWLSPDGERLFRGRLPPALVAAARAGAAEARFVVDGGARAVAELAPAPPGLVHARVRLADDDAVERELRARFLLTRAEAAVVAAVWPSRPCARTWRAPSTSWACTVASRPRCSSTGSPGADAARDRS